MQQATETRSAADTTERGPLGSSEAPLLGGLTEADMCRMARDLFSRNLDDMAKSCFATMATTEPQPCLTMDSIVEMKRTMDEMLRAESAPKPAPGLCAPFLGCQGVMPGNVGGMKIIERPWPKKQVKTHRKKRINKKWRKRYGFILDTSVDAGECFIVQGHTLIAYPRTVEALRKAVV